MSKQLVPEDVRAYLDGVEGERGVALRAMFETVHAAMPEGYELGISYGMAGWVIPLERYPNTYNKQPLSYVSLAAQKNYNALYLSIYADSEMDVAFRAEWAATGLRLDMGKSCLRFRTLADVDLGIIARTVSATSTEEFIETYEQLR